MSPRRNMYAITAGVVVAATLIIIGRAIDSIWFSVPMAIVCITALIVVMRKRDRGDFTRR